MNELKKRWLAPTPKFWQKVQHIGIICGSLGIALLAPPFGMPIISGYLITTGSIMGILSQFTIKDNSEIK